MWASSREGMGWLSGDGKWHFLLRTVNAQVIRLGADQVQHPAELPTRAVLVAVTVSGEHVPFPREVPAHDHQG